MAVADEGRRSSGRKGAPESTLMLPRSDSVLVCLYIYTFLSIYVHLSIYYSIYLYMCRHLYIYIYISTGNLLALMAVADEGLRSGSGRERDPKGDPTLVLPRSESVLVPRGRDCALMPGFTLRGSSHFRLTDVCTLSSRLESDIYDERKQEVQLVTATAGTVRIGGSNQEGLTLRGASH